MITDALLAFVATIVETITGWMPTVTLPDWLPEVRNGISEALAYAAQLDSWIPVEFGIQVLAVVLACVLVGLGIKLVRSIASYFLAGGGSSG